MLTPREQIEIYRTDGHRAFAIAEAVFADVISQTASRSAFPRCVDLRSGAAARRRA